MAPQDACDKFDSHDTLDGVEVSKRLADLRQGARIHRYLIVELIGKGGMGAVYKAYDPELNRRVAIKILTLAPQEDKTASLPHARIKREAQALARLNHPHVVSIYDVGEYENGVYISMEYVEGQTLREWIRDSRPSQKEIVDVFLKAGQGLQAAHRQGLVHRDFKPENLMVGQDGRVKILDFGLARSAELEDLPVSNNKPQDETASGEQLLSQPLTQVGTMLGTMAYMAPEHFLQQELDEKTDQFSYCVSLFEALYGIRPYRAKNTEQLKSKLTQGQFEIPDAVDLPDWIKRILVRGLATSKSQRYSSMTSLLEDLSYDPELAKEQKRRRLLVAFSLVASVLLLVGLGYTMFGGLKVCMGADEKVAGVWDQAVKEKVHQAFEKTTLAYASDNFGRLDKLFTQYLGSWRAEYTEICQATLVRRVQPEEIMALRMVCLDRHLKGARALSKVFTTADRTVVPKAIDAVSSLSSFSDCTDVEALLQSRIRPPKNEATKLQVEKVRDQLVMVYALQKAGKYESGLALSKQAVTRAEEVGYGPVLAESLFYLGELQERRAQYEAAQRSFQEAALLADRTRHDEIRAKALVGLLWVIGYCLSDFKQAKELNRRVEAVVMRLEGNWRLRSDWLNNLGNLNWSLHDWDQALEFYQRAMNIRQNELGPEHPSVAKSLNNIGNVLLEQGELPKALEYHRRALGIKQKVLGPKHPAVARSLNNIGNVIQEMGDFKLALEYYTKTLAIREKTLGPHHPEVASTLNNLGKVYRALGDYQRSIQFHQRALDIRENTLGPNHHRTSWAMAGLAWS